MATRKIYLAEFGEIDFTRDPLSRALRRSVNVTVDVTVMDLTQGDFRAGQSLR
jgi:hypothetical protein